VTICVVSLIKGGDIVKTFHDPAAVLDGIRGKKPPCAVIGYYIVNGGKFAVDFGYFRKVRFIAVSNAKRARLGSAGNGRKTDLPRDIPPDKFL
jgi:hypothetical protein